MEFALIGGPVITFENLADNYERDLAELVDLIQGHAHEDEIADAKAIVANWKSVADALVVPATGATFFSHSERIDALRDRAGEYIVEAKTVVELADNKVYVVVKE